MVLPPDRDMGQTFIVARSTPAGCDRDHTPAAFSSTGTVRAGDDVGDSVNAACSTRLRD